jgi:ATP-binding cassette subfamily B protein
MFDRPSTEAASSDAMYRALALVARHHTVDLAQFVSTSHPDRSYDKDYLFAAAARAGLRLKSMRIKPRKLAKLEQSLPVILILRGGEWLVLTAVNGNRYSLIDPCVGDDTVLALDQHRLGAIWAGDVILVRRKFEFDADDAPFGLYWIARELLRERGAMRDTLIAAFMLGLLAVMPIIVIRVVIDRVMYHRGLSTLLVLMIYFAVFVLFEAIFTFARRQLILHATARLDLRLSDLVFSKVLRLPIDYFERTQVGIIARDVGEIVRIRAFLAGQVLGTVLDSFVLIVFIPIMFLLSPALTFYVLGLCAVICLILVVMLPFMRQQAKAVFKAEGEKGALLTETLHGIVTVKTLALEERQEGEWEARVAEAARLRLREGRLVGALQAGILPLERFMTVGAVGLGAFIAVTSDGLASVGSLIAFMMLSARVAAPLIQLSHLVQQYDDAQLAVATVAALVNQPSEPARAGGLRSPLSGGIRFDDVTFSYPGAATPAIANLSLDIQDGSILGIVGKSGSGKTTLTKLLARLSVGYSGLIKVGETEVREYDLQHLRRHLGIVLQESFLFAGSIKENILLGNPSATFEEVIRAARLAGAEEFIERLPAGYETIVRQSGSNLSGGQKQRLAIARALIRDPEILIFDEATSALDPETEAILMANFRRIARGRTVLVISHRLSSLSVADSILVLAEGRKVDHGTHQDLMSRCEDYRRLWEQQNQHIDHLASQGAPIVHARSA